VKVPATTEHPGGPQHPRLSLRAVFLAWQPRWCKTEIATAEYGLAMTGADIFAAELRRPAGEPLRVSAFMHARQGMEILAMTEAGSSVRCARLA